jgi:hypothetical protein
MRFIGFLRHSASHTNYQDNKIYKTTTLYCSTFSRGQRIIFMFAISI